MFRWQEIERVSFILFSRVEVEVETDSNFIFILDLDERTNGCNLVISLLTQYSSSSEREVRVLNDRDENEQSTAEKEAHCSNSETTRLFSLSNLSITNVS